MELYWIWLSLCRGITKLRAAKLIKHFADPEAVWAAAEDTLRQAGVTEENLLESLLDKDLTTARAVLEQCRRNGWGVVDIMHPAYPKKLKTLTDAPLVLYLWGRLPAVDETVSIGVVGTRNAGIYGRRQTYRLAEQLARAGAVIVSGGALGIDTEALTAAVETGRPCVAVIAGGLDRLYPVDNEPLFRRIAANGCVLTEYIPGTPCGRFRFLERNRLISGLSDGVLITEAPMRSGAMSTARHAKKQGRDVYAMPGPITEANFGGCHDLIRNHGAVLTDSADQMLEPYRDRYAAPVQPAEEQLVLDAISASGEAEPDTAAEHTLKNKIDKKSPRAYTDPHKEDPETRLLELLQSEPRGAEQLAADSGLPLARLRPLILELELADRIQRLPNGTYRVIH